MSLKRVASAPPPTRFCEPSLLRKQTVKMSMDDRFLSHLTARDMSDLASRVGMTHGQLAAALQSADTLRRFVIPQVRTLIGTHAHVQSH